MVPRQPIYPSKKPPQGNEKGILCYVDKHENMPNYKKSTPIYENIQGTHASSKEECQFHQYTRAKESIIAANGTTIIVHQRGIHQDHQSQSTY